MIRSILLAALSCLLASAPLLGQSREEKVRADRRKVEAEGFWIYNDLAKGFSEARRTGKPLLVVLRCLPCEECVKLDDELVDQDPVLKPLLAKFVCVRQVSTNGIDLGIFQFDTDQSFAAFMLNGDGTIYGRFGTRSHRTQWQGDVSLAGLAKALQAALDLHADFPNNRPALAGKRGPKPDFASPEFLPPLKDKYKATLNYEGNVVASCIHCHQIGDAQREMLRSSGKPIPDEVLFPYPHPTSIGLALDSDERATVKGVAIDSPAGRAGFQPGDEIVRCDGQPPLSIADVQWVLHQANAAGAKLTFDIRRGGADRSLTLELPSGWRKSSDLSWRSSSWGLRRMATGGLLLETVPDDERPSLKLPDGAMALRVKHVGQYGPHAAAKQAGFQMGDVIVRFDDQSDLRRETDVLRHGVQDHRPGDQVSVVVLRDGRHMPLTLPMQP